MDEVAEVIRLLEFRLQIADVEEQPQVTNTDFPDRPILHFVGTARTTEVNDARLTGSVRMTPDGYVRWRYVSSCFISN